ncbi:MAG: septum formation protein [Rhodothermales bacterium]|jgi:septum formation protein
MSELILASQSARRLDLLQAAGFEPRVLPADIDETLVPGESPMDLVLRLAREKAEAVSASHPGGLVVGSDTVVCLGKVILGKPRDMDEARGMLRMLSGQCHQVHTGVHICRQADGVARDVHACTDVYFRELTDPEIDAYFGYCTPLDKAGGYGIQVRGDLIISHIDGLESAVIGLPVEAIAPLLRSLI